MRYLNNKLSNSRLCSYSKYGNETTLHTFHSYNLTFRLWSHFKLFLESNLILPYLLSQTSIFDFFDKTNNQNFVLLNHSLLLFKLKLLTLELI